MSETRTAALRKLESGRIDPRGTAAPALEELGLRTPAVQAKWLREALPPGNGNDWIEGPAGTWKYRRPVDGKNAARLTSKRGVRGSRKPRGRS
jgi:hypothetical protein